MGKKLTKREQQFCKAYLETGNPGEAARHAGYTGSVDDIGARNLAIPEIREEILRLDALDTNPERVLGLVPEEELDEAEIARRHAESDFKVEAREAEGNGAPGHPAVVISPMEKGMVDMDGIGMQFFEYCFVDDRQLPIGCFRYYLGVPSANPVQYWLNDKNRKIGRAILREWKTGKVDAIGFYHIPIWRPKRKALSASGHAIGPVAWVRYNASISDREHAIDLAGNGSPLCPTRT